MEGGQLGVFGAATLSTEAERETELADGACGRMVLVDIRFLTCPQRSR
ncbi:MAG: hypothetical protein JWP63_3008 [Candidatus Solibacter sp.]|jgi:hypothetical protein|nr:hypothetical protein [Candidatus Solibacter sp.]